MALCNQCGAQVPDGANNCPSCGAPIAAGQAQGTANNTQQQQTSSAGAATSGPVLFLGAEDHTAEFDPADIEANKTMCGLAYFGITFFLPLVACPKESKFAKFHANQALILFLVCIALGVVSGIFSTLGWWVAGFFWVLGYIVSGIGGLCTLALLIIGMVNTFGGRACELPLIGKITLIK